MKSIIWIALLFSFSTARAGADSTTYYKVFTGNIMGAEAVLHLYVSKGEATGYLYFVRDPRPFTIYTGEVKMVKTDSIYIYSSRSHMVSVNIAGSLTGQQIIGNATMYQDDKEIRKGAVQLMANTDRYTALNYIHSSGTTELPANLKNQSTCRYAASTVWPVSSDKSPLAGVIRKLFYETFNQQPGKEPSVLLPAALQKYLNGWKNSYIKAGVKETQDMGLSLSQEGDERLLVLSESGQLLTLAYYSYSFSGGAHGGSTTKLFSFDKRVNKLLTLSDVLTPAGIAALPSLLAKSARAQFKVQANQSLKDVGLFENSIPVTQNFWMDNAGLGFWYQEYEIGPFAYGPIVLFIPLAQISSFIQPGFLKK